MHDPHKNPNYIFTNCLHVSHIFFSHETSNVTLLGCYYDVFDSGMISISVETDFATLNDLLTEYGPEADEVIEQISRLLSERSEEDPVIDLSFSEHIFAFMIIMDADEDGNIQESEEYSYLLNAYAKRENVVPDFCECHPREKQDDRYNYFSSLLAMRYHIYLSSQKKHREHTALVHANLTDPLYFNLAKTQYEQLKSRQTN
jgi:hypothetical protein